MIKRLVDVSLSALLLALLGMPMLVIGVWVRLDSRGPALYWSERAGRDDRAFWMPKFRSMHVHAPTVATDQLTNPEQYLTRLGSWLRQTSLDELPQLWSVLIGDMSLVGPRPALLSQTDLRERRQAAGVDSLRPGITGWAQINGRDILSDDAKLALDIEYGRLQSLRFDLKILTATMLRVLNRENILH